AASPRKSAENIDPITKRQKNFAFTAVFSKHGVHLAYRPVHINRLRKVKVWLRNLNTTSTRTPSAKSFATRTKQRNGWITSRRKGSWVNRCKSCGCGSSAGWMKLRN